MEIGGEEQLGRETLREFQTRLAERLRGAQSTARDDSRLGFIAGGRQWLVSLDQVNEVVSVPEVAEAPWGKPWFMGVASVRGMLYGCTDLAVYTGLSDSIPKGDARLLLVHPRFGVNAAFRVDRTVGLRMVREMTRSAPAQDAAPWIEASWQAADGSNWVELDVEKLVTEPAFLEAGV
ncbi:MAG: chemotaxis protein CheW [Betaproteobacteria bacterium]|nr:chemotaxis protein CheW [Betaproteobacteria bacterium]